MKNVLKKYINIKGKKQKGYTLLEYCAGAAVIAGIVYGGLTVLAGNFNEYFGSIATWLDNRGGEIENPVAPVE